MPPPSGPVTVMVLPPVRVVTVSTVFPSGHLVVTVTVPVRRLVTVVVTEPSGFFSVLVVVAGGRAGEGEGQAVVGALEGVAGGVHPLRAALLSLSTAAASVRSAWNAAQLSAVYPQIHHVPVGLV